MVLHNTCNKAARGRLGREAAKLGGAKRDRTADLLHAMQALSQLSYGPISGGACRSRAALFSLCCGFGGESKSRTRSSVLLVLTLAADDIGDVIALVFVGLEERVVGSRII